MKKWALLLAAAACVFTSSYSQQQGLPEEGLAQLPILAMPELFIARVGDESIVSGVYFQESKDPHAQRTYPHNAVQFHCFGGAGGTCHRAYAFVYEGRNEASLNVLQGVYDIEHKDAHSPIAVNGKIDTERLVVDFDSGQARVEFHEDSSSSAWEIVSGEYALTHDPRLADLCRKHDHQQPCAQK